MTPIPEVDSSKAYYCGMEKQHLAGLITPSSRCNSGFRYQEAG